MSTHPNEESFAYASNVAAQLLLSDDYITVPLPLANLLGLEKAVLLKAVDAWCLSNERRQSQDHCKRGHFWTFGSYSEWAERLPFLGSTRSLQRLFLALEKSDLLVSATLSHKKGDRRKWYRVNRQKLGLLYLSSAPQSKAPKTDGRQLPLDDEHKYIVPKTDGRQLPLNDEHKYIVPKADYGDSLPVTEHKYIVPKADDEATKVGMMGVPKMDDYGAKSRHSITKTYSNDLTQRLNSTLSPLPPVTEKPEERESQAPKEEIVPEAGHILHPLASLSNQPELLGKQNYLHHDSSSAATITNPKIQVLSDNPPEPLFKQPELAAKPTHLDNDKYSAATATLTRIEATETRLTTRGELPVWRNKPGVNGINRDFAEHVRHQLQTKYREDKTLSDALSWIANREPGGKYYPNHAQLIAEAEAWQQSLAAVEAPTPGQILANELAIVLNSPDVAQVQNRFEQQGGKYNWEIAPGEPIPEIVEWYAKQIQNSQRPSWTGKPASVLAKEDLRDRFLAASIYEEWTKWASRLIGNHDQSLATLTPPPPNQSVTVDVTPKPVSMKSALGFDDPDTRIQRLQDFYDISGVHKQTVRRLLEENFCEWGLEVVNHKIQELPF